MDEQVAELQKVKQELGEIKVILRDQLQDTVTLLRRIHSSLDNLNK